MAHVVDVDYNDFDPNRSNDDRKERYLLEYLGSVESSLYKGNVVLCQVQLNIKEVISYSIFFNFKNYVECALSIENHRSERGPGSVRG